MLMDEESYLIMQEVFAENHASEKQCTKCIYYIAQYKDDYTLRHFGYGEVKIRPACSYGNDYSFVSHNPARSCRFYKEKVQEMSDKNKNIAEQKLAKIHKLLTTCKENFGKPCSECEFNEQCSEIDTDTAILQIIEE